MNEDTILIGLEFDNSNANKKIDDTQKKTVDLEKTFKTVGKAASIAFAGATGAIGLMVREYAQSEKATVKLNQALATQGLYTKNLADQYNKYATELSRATLYSDDEFTNAQAIIQAYSGKIAVSKELLKATADLAQATGVDLAQASTFVGKAIDGSTNSLGRSGLEIKNVTGESERMALVIEAINKKFRDQSLAAANGVGWFEQFSKSTGELAEAIGKELAPVLINVAKGLTTFVYALTDNKELVAIVAKVLAVTAAIAGLITIVSGAVLGFLKLKGIWMALEPIVGGISLTFVAWATAIAALGALVTVFALNWKQNFENIGTIAVAAGKIIAGALTLDTAKISAGYEELKEAIVKTASNFIDNPELNKLKTTISDAFSGGSDAEKEAKLKADSDAAEAAQEAKVSTLEGWAEETFAIEFASQEKITAMYKKNQDMRIKDQQTFFSTAATLQNAKNKELAAIGKAAAIMQIAIATPPAIASSFRFGASIGGPVLGAVFAGIAGVAMGVQAAAIAGVKVAKGGMISSGHSSYDNVPAILERGEFVAPKESAQDIIDARARELAGQSGGATEVILSMKGDIMKFFEAEILKRRAIGVSAI
jgi:hypothetical protein